MIPFNLYLKNIDVTQRMYDTYPFPVNMIEYISGWLNQILPTVKILNRKKFLSAHLSPFHFVLDSRDGTNQLKVARETYRSNISHGEHVFIVSTITTLPYYRFYLLIKKILDAVNNNLPCSVRDDNGLQTYRCNGSFAFQVMHNLLG